MASFFYFCNEILLFKMIQYNYLMWCFLTVFDFYSLPLNICVLV